MSARRAVFDPLEPSEELRWYVVRSVHGAVLEKRAIAGGTHLKRLFVSAMLEWIDAGWRLGEFSSCAGTFFCSRGVERRVVTVQSVDPDDLQGHGSSGLSA